MITATVLLAGALVLVAFAGLVSSIDAALAVSSRSDLLNIAEQAKRPKALTRIADDIDTHANALAFIRVVTETTAAVLAVVAFSLFFQNIWWAMLAAAVLMIGLTFVLVGSSPRAYGRHHADKVMRRFAPIVRCSRVALGPIAQGLVMFGNRVTPGLGRSTFTSEEQLLSLVDEAASNDLIEEDDRSLIHSVFDFTDRFVRAVMVPRTEMVTVDAAATMNEAMALFLERGVSRMPVVDDSADDVVGVLYLKDLVQFAYRDDSAWRGEAIRPISRPATFVPESMRAETLLQQMKRDAVHVCLVVDEHGGISGLVTLEDLIEELVGEIADEYDHVSTEIVELAPGSYRVSSRLPLDEVGDLFGLDLEDDDVDSIGGLLGKALGQIPQPGATASVLGLTLTGGTSRGRGRGIATVFVERAAGEEQSDD
jgi:CBS domain containing-hemolysin-like protein